MENFVSREAVVDYATRFINDLNKEFNDNFDYRGFKSFNEKFENDDYFFELDFDWDEEIESVYMIESDIFYSDTIKNYPLIDFGTHDLPNRIVIYINLY